MKKLIKRLLAFMLCVMIIVLNIVPVMIVSAESYEEKMEAIRLKYNLTKLELDVEFINTTYSVLKSMGITYKYKDFQDLCEWLKNFLSGMSYEYQEILGEMVIAKIEEKYGSGGSGTERPVEGDKVGITLSEYEKLKHDTYNFLQTSAGGNIYYPFSTLHMFNKTPTESDGAAAYNGIINPDGKIMFPITPNVIYTLLVYINSTNTLHDYTTLPNFLEYYYLDFYIDCVYGTTGGNLYYRIHGSDVWQKSSIYNAGSRIVYGVYLYYDVKLNYFRICNYSRDTTGSQYYWVNFNSMHNVGLKPGENLIDYPDKIYINYIGGLPDYIDPNNLIIDTRIYDTDLIEKNWQTIINQGGDTYQYLTIYNYNECYNKQVHEVLPTYIVNNYTIINNYNGNNDEPVEDSVWFKMLMQQLRDMDDNQKENALKIITAIENIELSCDCGTDFFDILGILADIITALNTWGITDKLTDIEKEIKGLRADENNRPSPKDYTVLLESIIWELKNIKPGVIVTDPDGEPLTFEDAVIELLILKMEEIRQTVADKKEFDPDMLLNLEGKVTEISEQIKMFSPDTLTDLLEYIKMITEYVRYAFSIVVLIIIIKFMWWVLYGCFFRSA